MDLIEATRQMWTEAVKGPGKFEGERPYVAYYWEMYLNGCADGDDDEILSFNVTPEDTAIFPELKDRNVIKIVETDQGFVCEIHS